MSQQAQQANRRPIKGGNPYFARLVLLIPSEVIALYLTFKEIAASFLGIWTVICLILVIFVRSIGTYREGKSIQVGSVLIAVVSFYPGVISVAIGLWTFLIPYFYTGDRSEI